MVCGERGTQELVRVFFYALYVRDVARPQRLVLSWALEKACRHRN